MSVLEGILEEEYERAKRLSKQLSEEIDSLPKGSLRAKKIGNHEYYYLNYREGNRVKSDYIPAGQVNELQEKIARRKELKEAFKEQQKSIKQIQRALGRKPHVK